MRPMTAQNARFLLMASVALTVTGCGKKEAPPEVTATAAAPSTTLEGQVDIVAWPG